MKKQQKPEWWDWTQDRTGTSNSSREYLRIVRRVEALVTNLRVGDDPYHAARHIVAELAHGQLLVPAREEGAPR